MNLWECSKVDCTQTCVGLGGAIGLVAIGWYFKRGSADPIRPPTLFCPGHHPSPAMKKCKEFNCEICQQTKMIQAEIKMIIALKTERERVHENA